MADAEEREIRLELLVGRMVVDAHNKHVGRIEEVIADMEEGVCHILEFHLGPFALRERIAATLGGMFSSRRRHASSVAAEADVHLQAHIAPQSRAPSRKRPRGRLVVSWAELDLSDPRVPVWKPRGKSDVGAGFS